MGIRPKTNRRIRSAAITFGLALVMVAVGATMVTAGVGNPDWWDPNAGCEEGFFDVPETLAEGQTSWSSTRVIAGVTITVSWSWADPPLKTFSVSGSSYPIWVKWGGGGQTIWGPWTNTMQQNISHIAACPPGPTTTTTEGPTTTTTEGPTTTTTEGPTTTTTEGPTTTTTEPPEGWLKIEKDVAGPGGPDAFYYKVIGPAPDTTVVDEGYFPASGDVVVGPLVPGEYTVTEVDPGSSWTVTILDSYMSPTDGVVYVYGGSSEEEPVLVQVQNTEIPTTTTTEPPTTTTDDVTTTTTDDVTTTTGFITTTTGGDTTTTTGVITTTTEGDTTTTSTPTTVSRATTTTTVLGVLGVQAGGGGLAGGGPVGWVLIVLGCLTVAGGAARYLKPGVKTSS